MSFLLYIVGMVVKKKNRERKDIIYEIKYR